MQNRTRSNQAWINVGTWILLTAWSSRSRPNCIFIRC